MKFIIQTKIYVNQTTLLRYQILINILQPPKNPTFMNMHINI